MNRVACLALKFNFFPPVKHFRIIHEKIMTVTCSTGRRLSATKWAGGGGGFFGGFLFGFRLGFVGITGRGWKLIMPNVDSYLSGLISGAGDNLGCLTTWMMYDSWIRRGRISSPDGRTFWRIVAGGGKPAASLKWFKDADPSWNAK